MPFLKTLSGGGGSCKQIDDYLSFGHRSTEDHEERIEKYLAGDKSASRSMAFGHSPGLPDTPYGWHKVMDATRKRFGKDKPPEWFEKKRKSNPNLIWRNYYQWILSPDPRDRASAEEVGQLAQGMACRSGLAVDLVRTRRQCKWRHARPHNSQCCKCVHGSQSSDFT